MKTMLIAMVVGAVLVIVNGIVLACLAWWVNQWNPEDKMQKEGLLKIILAVTITGEILGGAMIAVPFLQPPKPNIIVSNAENGRGKVVNIVSDRTWCCDVRYGVDDPEGDTNILYNGSFEVDESTNVTARVVFWIFQSELAQRFIDAERVYVERIELSETELVLKPGGSASLQAMVFPENATNRTLNWSSGNEKVAVVGRDGTVIAVGTGSTQITVWDADGNAGAVCTVKVKKSGNGTEKQPPTPTPILEPPEESPQVVPVESLQIISPPAWMREGESEQLYIKLIPSNANDRTVLWNSSNPSVVQVDENGILTAFHWGTAVITAEVETKTASMIVDVQPDWRGLNYDYLEMEQGDEIKLKPRPDAPLPEESYWETDNPMVAAMSQDGWVCAENHGSCMVWLWIEGVKYGCEVTVLGREDFPEEIGDIDLPETMFVGENYEAWAEVWPEEAVQEVYFESSDSELIQVVNGCCLIACGEGEVEITVYSAVDEEICETRTVQVILPPIPYVELESEDEFYVEPWEAVKLHYWVGAEDCSGELSIEIDVDSDGETDEWRWLETGNAHWESVYLCPENYGMGHGETYELTLRVFYMDDFWDRVLCQEHNVVIEVL